MLIRAKSPPTVVVAKVLVPVTVNRLDTVDVPATREVVVALIVVRLVMKAVIEDNKLEKKEVEVAAVPEALVKERVLIVADDTVRSEIEVVAADSLEIVVVAKVLVPCTVNSPVLVVLAKVLSVDVSLDMEVVDRVVVAAVRVLVAVTLPATKLDPVALSKKSEDRYAVVARSMEEKRLVDVPFTLLRLAIVAVAAERLDILVVAKVVVPSTVKLPLAVDDPIPERNDIFSTQLDPFQYRVVLVAVPEAKAPPLATLIHLVDVPVLDRT